MNFCYGHGKFEEKIRAMNSLELSKFVLRNDEELGDLSQTKDQEALEQYLLASQELVSRFYSLTKQSTENPVVDRNPVLGDMVIVLDGEEPYKIGRYQGEYEFKSGGNLVPYVFLNGMSCICMGLIIKYDRDLRKKLDTLSPKEQWNLLSLNYKRD